MKTKSTLQEARISRGLSMRPVEYLALAWLAVRAGHLSRSRALQSLIDDRMTKELGPNWEGQIDEKEIAA